MEEAFHLQMHLGMSYTEVRLLPTRYRRWYIDRLLKHFKDKNTARNNEEPDANVSNNMQSLGDYQNMLDQKFK